MSRHPMIRLKRAYDPPSASDGRRLLVERLWPRGVKKELLAADAWLKDAAPSASLRTWFGHRVERWDEFRRRYRAELRANPRAWAPILEAAQAGPVTLVYAARDTEHNGALVLRDFVAERTRRRRRPPTSRRGRARAPSTRR
ncbi:MAG TPA: DUF488 family protein [Polyangia bacterium]|nr:DUF488 family protein [Polyangia bacterium]